MLYNLAELQNDCSKFFKISPDETLAIVQELYEKKLVTYPRTDARVLSTAVAKEIHKNIGGLRNIPGMRPFAEEVLEKGTYKNITKTRYVNDKQITDHYAIIPTGQGFGALKSVNERGVNVYEAIVRRFLAIFYPPAIYQKVTLTTAVTIEKASEKQRKEQFYASFKVLADAGYLKVMNYSFQKKKTTAKEDTESSESTDGSDQADSAENDTSVLSEEAKNNYDKFVLFVKGEYEGDADSLLAATEDTEAVATVTLDEQTAKSVAETVEKDYYDILKDGTESYEADGTEKYQSTELNMMDQKLKKLFSIDSSQEATEATDVTAAILADVPQEDKQTLYKETMKYLAGLYGENTDSSEESAAE